MRPGTMRAKASGMETTVVATTKAVRWPSPVQVLTANTAPLRSRQNATAAESALKASLGTSPLSRTAKTAAMDKTQFNPLHAAKVRAARGKNKRTASPDQGSGGGVPEGFTPAAAWVFEPSLTEIKCTRIAAPNRPRIAASATAARRKFNRSSGRIGRELLSGSAAWLVSGAGPVRRPDSG